MKFKTGDRVKYTGLEQKGDKSDFGTIDEFMRGTRWWVHWDNGERLHALEDDLMLIESTEPTEVPSNTKPTIASLNLGVSRLSVLELKALLNKLPDQLEVSFSQFKVYF